ncbi:unnamed protein product [Phaeothamnion confervicola]
MYGQYTPDGNADLGKAQEALNELAKVVPPDHSDVQFVPPAIAARVFGQVDPMCTDWRKSLRHEQIFKSTSAIAEEPIPAEAIAKLRTFLENSPQREGETNPDKDMVQLLPGGGATARKASDETGVFRRQAAYVLQYDAYWDQAHPEDEKVNSDWVESLRSEMLPWAQGA